MLFDFAAIPPRERYKLLVSTVTPRPIAWVVSQTPEEAANHFGWMGHFFSIDGPASSAQTQTQLGWKPAQPGLIADLNAEHYFEHTAEAVVLHD